MSTTISNGTKANRTKTDPRLQKVIVHFNENNSVDDAMRPLYEFMYSILTSGNAQEQRKGA